MRIVMISINPVFPDRVIGGSTKHLRNVAIRLGEMGHDVTILCTEREDTAPFAWRDNVRVRPIIQLKQPFPQPYEIAGHRMAYNIRQIAAELATADRYYLHDGEFLFPPLMRPLPTVVSLRDNVYPETMLGSFLFNADALITIADYSRRVVLDGPGQIIPELAARTVAVPNGIDFNHYRPLTPGAVYDYLDFDPAAHTVLLHPHRPEPSKGLDRTIAVADRLVHRYGIGDLKVLVPRWFDADRTAEDRRVTDGVLSEIAARGLNDHFAFHGWVPQSLMPELYNIGDVTLALGYFVEAFGNTPYESLACGTPAVVARVATHRTLLPDDLLDKVHYGDDDDAARLVAQIVRERPQANPATLAYLRRHYDVEQQLQGYADVILNASKLPPVTYRLAAVGPETCYRLAAWCYEWGNALFYHDYRAEHVALPQLSALLAERPAGFSAADAAQHGVDAATLHGWYKDGYVVPA